ncbi:uncharacterized protein M421DRAFT_176820 [Didymella exigua CBS 183.55]|uniref:Uncharacterized protein n=1 Tax=Didymella exigua CBS 183.55 TaxID=1150837 RepID=A0A6A5RK23_9PLEO|nr:uncharacterized protein M421DRAFT_176820 [Didymella exigua CBS 183.55]KAF1927314.1 hypothetical protein M421DRAFT_176820 [Didymella exigua CBS 183.55]
MHLLAQHLLLSASNEVYDSLKNRQEGSLRTDSQRARPGPVRHRCTRNGETQFGFCQESGGRYHGNETKNHTAAGLKKAAAESRGLLSIEIRC